MKRFWTLIPASVINFSAVSAVLMLTQLHVKTLGGTTLETALITAFYWIAFLFSPAWGTLSDYHHRKTILIVILILSGLTIAGLSLSSSVAGVISVYFLFSIIEAGFPPVALALISAVSMREERGKNLSYLNAARSFGFTAGNLLAGLILEYFGFNDSYLIVAISPFAAVSLFFFVHEKQNLPIERQISRPEKYSSLQWEENRFLAQRGLWQLYIPTVFRQIAISGATSLIYVYMFNDLKIAPSWIGLIAAINPGTQILGMVVFGHLADHVGRKKVFMLGFALSAIVPLIFAFASNSGLMALGFAILGLSFSSLISGATAFIGDRASVKHQGRFQGLFMSSQGLGGALGALLAGGLAAPKALGFRGMFLTMAAVGLLGWMWALFRTEESLKRRPHSLC